MRNFILSATLITLAYANDVDALKPEVWAQEALMQLEANMVMGNLVHRDFSNEIASQGDVVNAHRPGTFVAKRKGVNDNVTIQDAAVSKVPVRLNQHLHTSFIIRDGEESKSMKDLVTLFLTPAVQSIAQQVDRILLSQALRFKANSIGALGTSVTKDTVIAAREKMNTLLIPMQGRNLIITAGQEATLLGVADFVNAEKVGDQGTALREGSLGRKFGLDIFMSQNASQITDQTSARAGAINNAGGYAAGTTTLTVDGFTGATPTGSMVTIGGHLYIVTGHTETTGNTTQIVLERGLDAAVANDAVVTQWAVGAINLAAGYAAGYDGAIAADGGSVGKVGLPTCLGTNIYGQIEGTAAAGLILDRPLAASVADDAVIGFGANGNYGFGFHRNALALVSRPLAQPRQGTGAMSAVASYNGLGLRVVMTYDGDKQGHLVTVDLLCGTEVLDSRLGVPFLG